MSTFPTGIGAISLFVADIDVAKHWYATAFGTTPMFEDDVSAVFKLDNTVVNLLQVGAAHELIAPAAVGVESAPARFQLTMWVDDADCVAALLRDRGIELINGPIDRAWGQRTACFADPDGHIWEIAQHIS